MRGAEAIVAAMVLANWAASPISRAMPCLIAEQSFGCGTATLLKDRSQDSASPRQTGHGASTYSEQKRMFATKSAMPAPPVKQLQETDAANRSNPQWPRAQVAPNTRFGAICGNYLHLRSEERRVGKECRSRW